MDRKKLAETILIEVGGQDNVANCTHCATRLRFNLKDAGKANTANLEEMDEVMSIVQSGGQYQIVIGPAVGSVYEEIAKNIKPGGNTGSLTKKEGIVGTVFSVLQGGFGPLLPVFAGAGMLKALLNLFMLLGVLSDQSTTYLILSAAGNSVFNFLPIMLGVTISQKLGMNPFIGAAIGGALLDPNFTALIGVEGATFLGLPVLAQDYASSVFPIFFAMAIYYWLNKGLKRIIPAGAQMILVSLISLVVMVPLTVLAVGPFATYISAAIGTVINALAGFSSILLGAFLGGLWTVVASLGLHWAAIPLVMTNMAVLGYDFIIPMTFGSVIAGYGIGLGVFLKTKDKKLKTYAGTSFVTALFGGIGEPIFYGIMFKYRRTLVMQMILGGILGGIVGALDIKMTALVMFPSILGVVGFEPTLLFTCIYIGGLLLSAAAVWFFGYESKAERLQRENEQPLPASAAQTAAEAIASPLSGKLINLAEIDDPVFAEGTMGRGVAILPDNGEVLSPVNGVISTVQSNLHAVGIQSDNGAEIMIHIGLNTVELGGKHFEVLVNRGDRVTLGTPIMRFELDKITAAGYSLVSPVVVVNSDDYSAVSLPMEGKATVSKGDTIIQTTH